MREIKFRAWIKNERKMVYGKEATSSAHFTDSFKYSADEIELMEYTGINKDEKEIYEGDILFINDNYKLKFYGEVIYDSRYGAFFVKGKNLCAILGWHVPIKYVEILGNKWENPELLELLKEELK